MRAVKFAALIESGLVDEPTQNAAPESMADELPSGYTSESLALVRGMFVKVNLHCEPTRSLAVIPESVLRPGKQVWLMRNEKLAMETIRIARIEQGRAYIDMTNSPLHISDQIVSSPVPNARNGLPVSLMTDKPMQGKQLSGSGTRQEFRPATSKTSTSESLDDFRYGEASRSARAALP